MDSTLSTEVKSNTICRFFRNPWVCIIGSIASIVALPVSGIFFWASISSPGLTYMVHPAKAAVFRANQSSRLSVSCNGKMIDGDITAAQIAIWNDGKQPIRSSDILEPLLIKTNNGWPILEAKIRQASRDVVNLHLDDSKIDKGEITVSWKIMEHNDGGVIQLIYKGNDQVDITANSIIEGQSGINYEDSSSKRVDFWFSSTCVLPCISMLLLLFFFSRQPWHERSQHKVFLLVVPLSLMILLLIITLSCIPSKPPFEF